MEWRKNKWCQHSSSRRWGEIWWIGNNFSLNIYIFSLPPLASPPSVCLCPFWASAFCLKMTERKKSHMESETDEHIYSFRQIERERCLQQEKCDKSLSSPFQFSLANSNQRLPTPPRISLLRFGADLNSRNHCLIKIWGKKNFEAKQRENGFVWLRLVWAGAAVVLV